MSLQIQVPKEIKNFKEEIIFGLTLKQLVWCLLGMVVGILTFTLLYGHLAIDIISMICVLITIPFAFMGFANYNGLSGLELIKYWAKVKLFQRPLVYQSSNEIDLKLEKFKFQDLESAVDLVDNSNPSFNSAKPPKKDKDILRQVINLLNDNKNLLFALIILVSAIIFAFRMKNLNEKNNSEAISTTEIEESNTVSPTTTTRATVPPTTTTATVAPTTTTKATVPPTTTTATVAPTTTTATVAPTTTTTATVAPTTTTSTVATTTTKPTVKKTIVKK